MSDPPQSTRDEQLDGLLRAVAHAPARLPPPEPAQPGDRWGAGDRYVIEARIGRGGMGTVYSANDTLLHRTVALKVLDAGTGHDEAAHRARLLREARIAAGVEHERVARVYDVGEHEGTLFVAMELLRGVTLRRWMAGRAATSGEILAVARQIAEGLAALHAVSVFHRDLKPENVMLTDRGGVRLLDFGLARHARAAAEGQDPALAAFVEGESLPAFSGTPGYMAPEQWTGDPLDAKVDVFALGVIVHELVTGARPFDRSYEAAPTAQWLAPDFADAAWKEMPAGLAEITARMLARDPGERFADGAAVVRVLDGVQADPVTPVALLPRPVAAEIAQATTEVAPGTRSQRKRGRVVASIVAAVGVAAVGVVVPLKVMRKKLPPPPPGMVLIDEGTVRVGRSAEEVEAQCAEIGPRCKQQLLEYQEPAGAVSVPPFYLDVREVTNAEMAELLNRVRSSLYNERDEDNHVLRYVRFNKGTGPFEGYIYDLWSDLAGIDYTTDQGYRPRPGREGWPVNQVTWLGARLYCTSQGKRLPTEDEWEAAARGRDDRKFPWGSSPPACGQVVVPNDGRIPMSGDCPKLDSPVEAKRAPLDVTPQGVHDLGGNVAEWVDAVYVPGDRLSNLHVSGGDLPRVIRGGSFFLSLLARTSVRNQRPPTYAGYDLGFRCASDPSRHTNS
jgi:formylglycine-generating enzyme required for sulfatase activity/predicted Ser/Thr protein kinase